MQTTDQNWVKNSMTVKIGGKEIYLRSTFENLYAFEKGVMSVGKLGFILVKEKFLNISDLVMLVYYFQGNMKPDAPQERLLSLADVHEICSAEGMKLQMNLLEFISMLTAGEAPAMPIADQKPVTEKEKKRQLKR